MVIGNFDPGMATTNWQTWQCTLNQTPPQKIPNPTILLKSSTLKSCSTTTPCSSSTTGFCDEYVQSYYYVDAVTVIPVNQTPPNYSPYVTPNQPLCLGSPTTYNLQNVPFGASVTWSVSNTNLFSGTTSGSGASANLTAAKVVKGGADLTYTESSACGTYAPIQIPPTQNNLFVQPTSIWVGNPVFNSVLINSNPGPWPLCTSSNDNITYSANQANIISSNASPNNVISYTMSGSTGVVSGGSLSATDYEFTSKSTGAKFTITAAANNGCGTTSQCFYFSNSGPCTFPVLTSITIDGSPPPNADCSSATPFGAGTHTIVASDNTGTAINFSLGAQSGSVTGRTISSTQYQFTAATNASFIINITTSNSCGAVGFCIFFCNGGISCVGEAPVKGAVVNVFPNPASSTMTVQVSDSLSGNSNSLEQPLQLYLYNRYSQNVYSIQSCEKNIQIPVDGLPADIYYLNVFYKNAVLQKQIVVRR